MVLGLLVSARKLNRRTRIALRPLHAELSIGACGSMPVLPTALGEVPSKDGLVRTFEALAELVGQPVQSATGARLLGGHGKSNWCPDLAAHGAEASKLRMLLLHARALFRDMSKKLL